MTDTAVQTTARHRRVRPPASGTRAADVVIRSLVPLVLALLAGGMLLAVLGVNPFSFYGSVWTYGVSDGNWEQSAVTMIPFLLIAIGLIVIFRANIWNLGYGGQFALAAALVAGLGPCADHPPAAGGARRPPLPARGLGRCDVDVDPGGARRPATGRTRSSRR